MPETLVLLHGFAGTRRMWDGVISHLDPQRYRPLALDLPGHGELADRPGPVTFQACVQAVLGASPGRLVLCGYSMGGRIALRAALDAPGRVARLVLVSSTAGIEDEHARAQRRAADGALADLLERAPFEEFLDRWSAQALFAGDPPKVDHLAREDQRRNRPPALARALRGIGTGEMTPVWSRLQELSMPVNVLVGERDVKFAAIARRMVRALPRGTLTTLAGGHRLPLECPRAVAGELSGAPRAA